MREKRFFVTQIIQKQYVYDPYSDRDEKGVNTAVLVFQTTDEN